MKESTQLNNQLMDEKVILATKVMGWKVNTDLSASTGKCFVDKTEDITNHEVIFSEEWNPHENFVDAWKLVAKFNDIGGSPKLLFADYMSKYTIYSVSPMTITHAALEALSVL